MHRAGRSRLQNCAPWLLLAGLMTSMVAEASELRRTPTVQMLDRVRPAVVNIQGEKNVPSVDGHAGPADTYRRVNGMGTGVVIDERGYVLTNLHVVDGVRQINVTLADGSAYVARIVSQDFATDLAIIKIDTRNDLPVIDLGTSRDLMLGEPVVAVGNAFGYEHSVTRGIISALHRSVQVNDDQGYDDLIQTDASINPGNSGGPLLNVDGQMIGVVVAVRAGAQGIGFAIPVDKAMDVAAELLSTRQVSNAWHGISAKREFSAGHSVFVVDMVAENSPAQAAGLARGDIVRSVGTQELIGPLDLQRALLASAAGDEVNLSVEREGATLALNLVLAPAGEDAAWSRLGLKLKPIPAKQFRQYGTKYRGGLTVSQVRAGGPAAEQGIRPGDVLVGMHIWETVSLDNVSYVLNRPDFDSLDPLKFYILRGSETLYGHMRVARRK